MIGVSIITFAISHVIPADPAVAALGDHATDAQIAAFRGEYHLDRPLPEQYVIYVNGILHGDLGKSIRTRRSAADALADSFPATLELSFAALAVSLLVGIPAGIWSAIYRGRFPDVVVRIAALAGGSLPVFWLGLVVIGLFYYQLGWLPGGGRLDTFVSPPPTRTGLYVIDSLLALDLDALRSSVIHLVLPALTLGYFSTAVIARMTRSSMLEVLGQDYMRTARAKGLTERLVVVRHGPRNALIPTARPPRALGPRPHPPTPEHWFGTDQLGRDILSRLLYGSRISLLIGLVVVASAGVFGTFVGVIAGYAGGLVDEALMRLTEVFLAFPALILAMAIAGALGPSLTNAIIALAAVTWAIYARLARGQILSLRRREFVEAARGIGASQLRIILRHLLPNAVAPLMVQASFDMGSVIIAAAGLSFIGFGAQPPTPEWGVMISEGRNFISTQLWLSLFPGLAILFAVGAVNLRGDRLRDIFDPRLRRAG